ncbi:MAG: cyclic nucleotide-binding domain-containing protein [Treponema sp.]|jgi:Na+/H+ antiporter NhaC|nr:cyclic nucleotide-binding domain-containing protein [Treponema sp.]
MEPKVITREYIRDFFKLGDTKRDIAVLNYIITHLVLKEFAHNSYICRAGDPANAMYFIESGLINVRGAKNEVINELQPGAYFGEIAAITGDKRGANVQAKGNVQVLELDQTILNALIRNNPKIYSLFLKNVYDQGTERYRKLMRLLNSRRGLGFSPSKKKITPLSLLINYYVVFLLFLVVFLFAPNPAAGPAHPIWLCIPMVFLVVYIIITGRALESIVLSVLLVTITLAKANFIGSFYEHILLTIQETPDIILIVVLMGSLTRLFSASGSINALKHVVEQHIKSRRGTMLAAFLSMVIVAIDEYLCILIAGACFTSVADQQRIPREKSSIVMGMSPYALCILSPISLTGIYLTGIITLASGDRGLFFQALRFNFAAIFVIVFVVLLALELMPLVGSVSQGAKRVKAGGLVYPPGSETEGDNDDAANQGKISNLILPILMLISSSIIIGTLREGSLAVDVLYGMLVTLIFTFLLYCFRQYMTPEQYFKNVVFGIESMLAPIVMFVMGKCFAAGMDEIGFSTWLNGGVQNMIGGQVWLLPAIIFGVCTLVGALFDNPWAMYAIGIPLAVTMTRSMGGNPGLYIGAVCAAGLIGNEIALGDIFFTGPILGINPMAYYRAKLPYVIFITIAALFAYVVVGYLQSI